MKKKIIIHEISKLKFEVSSQIFCTSSAAAAAAAA
jgi:hypothetical protein